MGSSGITLYDWCLMNNCMSIVNHLVNPVVAKKCTYASHTPLLFKCDNGHIFEQGVFMYTNKCRVSFKKFSCPICSGKRLLKGYNDVATTDAWLLDEWFDSSISPTEVSRASHRIIQFKCALGHVWSAKLYTRTVNGNGCPYCSNRKTTSRNEQLVFLYMKKYFNDAENGVIIHDISVDVFIPSLQVAVEYDGSFWHSLRDTSYKVDYLSKFGIRLYTISGCYWEDRRDTFYFDDTTGSYKDFLSCINLLLKSLDNTINEDFSDYNIMWAKACSLYNKSVGKRLEIPDNIRNKWSDLNGYGIELMLNDNIDKLWRCSYGHTFRRRYDVMKRTNGICPYCTNKRSFQYYLLYVDINGVVVYDKSDYSISICSKADVIKCINSGLNIKGIYLFSGNLIFDILYLDKISYNTFVVYFTGIYENLSYVGENCRQIYNYIVSILNYCSWTKLKLYLSELLKSSDFD